MQAKNLAIFITLSALVLAGWILLQQLVPKPAQDQAKKEEKKKKPGLASMGATTVAFSASPVGTGPLSGVASLLAGNIEVTRPPTAEEPKVLPVKEEQKTLTLGQDKEKYEFQVVLTTLGGGVRSLTFHHFEGADEDGKPTGKPLVLIPDDAAYPSNLLYHYPNTGPNTRPEDTLGKQPWEIISKGKDKKPGVEVDSAGVQTVIFQTRDVPDFDKLTITKTYSLAPGEYHLRFKIEIRDDRPENSRDNEAREFRYQLAGAHGLPIEGKWYTSIYRNAMVGLVNPKGSVTRTIEDSRRISIREGGDRVPEGGLGDDAIQYAAVATQYFTSAIVVKNPEESRNIPPQIIEWARPTLESTEMKGKVLGIRGNLLDLIDEKPKIYSFVIDPHCHIDMEDDKNSLADLKDKVVYVTYRPGEKTLTAKEIRTARIAHKPFFDDISVRVNSKVLTFKPGGRPEVHEFLLYNGPIKVRLLSQFTGAKAVDQALVTRYEDDLHLNTLTDYHSDSWIGAFSNKIGWTFLLIKCTNLMHWLLGLLHSIVPVYGLCIILLTVMVRGLMFPISRKQALLSMRMQELAPELKKVQEKYKNDPQERTRAVMELYRKHGVNPLGGCLPLLLQMPIFLGLYYCLQESIHFRLASFLWIDNLAAPDMLFYWGQGFPWFTDPNNIGGLGYLGPFFNLLPVFAVVLMLAQQKMMAPPAVDDQQKMQQKMLKYMMIFIGFMFYKVAAGLCIYFIATSLWGMAERKFLPKKKPGVAAPAAAGPTTATGASRPAPRQRKAAPPAKKNNDGAFQKVKDWWADVLKQAKKK
jgi:YidC/Oxa1 family membrane protein insertase